MDTAGSMDLQPGQVEGAPGHSLEGVDISAHLQVGHSEDDRVHQEDSAGLLVDGRCDDL